jgi:hypothetical protein
MHPLFPHPRHFQETISLKIVLIKVEVCQLLEGNVQPFTEAQVWLYPACAVQKQWLDPGVTYLAKILPNQ